MRSAPPGFLTENEAAHLLGLTVWGLRGWRSRAYGPPARKLGRLVIYEKVALNVFLANLAGDA